MNSDNRTIRRRKADIRSFLVSLKKTPLAEHEGSLDRLKLGALIQQAQVDRTAGRATAAPTSAQLTLTPSFPRDIIFACEPKGRIHISLTDGKVTLTDIEPDEAAREFRRLVDLAFGKIK